MRWRCSAAVLIVTCLSFASTSHAALVAGNIAFTAFNADEDGWAMVALVNISANTTIFFSDNEWNESAIGSGGAFNTGESYFQWGTGASVINAGTVIRFSSIDTTSLAASIGSLSRATVSGSANYGFSNDADTIYSFLGSSASSPTTFLAAASSGGFTSANGALTNTGLTAGTNAIQVATGADFAEYTASRSNLSSFAGYLARVANPANWSGAANVTNSLDFSGTAPNTTAFTITGVPEASSFLFGGLICGVLGVTYYGRRGQREQGAGVGEVDG
jgi:hypothetical protein